MSLSAYIHRFVPGPDASAPPVLLLHGTGGDEDDLLPLGRELFPRSPLLAPRGDVSEHGAPRFFRRFAEGVFDLEDVRRRAAALAAFLAAAAGHYRFDPARVLAVGFSNGANMATALLQRHPAALAGGVLFRPMVVLDEAATAGSLAGRRVLLVSGARDPIVPADHPARLAALLHAGGADVTAKVVAGGHGLTPVDLATAKRWL
ncbi:MAG TPA: alpha/beta hydrolase [Opitutaceae bacterium]|nr:alpha/beta hydrolase [Opitutaceae bacterium]